MLLTFWLTWTYREKTVSLVIQDRRVLQEQRYRWAFAWWLFFMCLSFHALTWNVLWCIVTGWARCGRKRRERRGWTSRIEGNKINACPHNCSCIRNLFQLYKLWNIYFLRVLSKYVTPITQGDKGETGEQGLQGPMVWVFPKVLTL